MRLSPVFGFGLLVLAACQVGTHANNYAPAKGPAGAMIDLRLTDKTRITGELLAVEDSAFLVLRDSQLVRVALFQVRTAAAPKVSFRGKMSEETRERLRLISRYPQGVSSELEGRLRQAYGQSAVTSPS